MDAMMTARGDVWVSHLGANDSIKSRLQDPPEQVIHDCNKEVDETLRQVFPSFMQVHF